MNGLIPLIVSVVVMGILFLYLLFDSICNGLNDYLLLSLMLFVFSSSLLCLSVKGCFDMSAKLNAAFDSGYELYIDGQKSLIGFDPDFIIDHYSFTIDDENRNISCTPK